MSISKFWRSELYVKLTDLTAVRLLFWPYKNWKRKRNHNRYLETADSAYLKTLKGIHQGERCFVIGNGPSLNAEDLDKLKGEYTFAANRIFTIFDKTDWRPTYYMSVDFGVLRSVASELNTHDLGHMFLVKDKEAKIDCPPDKVTHIFYDPLKFHIKWNKWHDLTSYISEDVSNHFSNGHTVTFAAIQLAIYMGFKEIYLLGVDHNYSVMVDTSGKLRKNENVQDYFDGKRHFDGGVFSPASVEHSYKVAREYCDTHGIKICNATRGGKLEIFERVDLDDVVRDKK